MSGSATPEQIVLGVDGARAGWVVVQHAGSEPASVELVSHLEEILVPRPAVVAIDMPVGLLDAPRDADRAAREVLPGRGATVFPAPPRGVVEAVRRGEVATHAAASRLARELTGVGLSMQSWRLVPRIVEVDDLLSDGAPLHEVHPEVAFTLLAGDVLPSKRTWAGLTTRRAVLERHGLRLPDRFPGDSEVAPDDVVDAAACALVADAIARGGRLVTLPPDPVQHDRGRAVVITARVPDPAVPRVRQRPR